MKDDKKITLYGLNDIREAVRKTPTGRALSFSAWLRLAAIERLEREQQREDEAK
jgi:hypothetical protein